MCSVLLKPLLLCSSLSSLKASVRATVTSVLKVVTEGQKMEFWTERIPLPTFPPGFSY